MTPRDYHADSYAHIEMLKDKDRITWYRSGIRNNRHLFKDKTVLHVGCGTGILSMFAVQAGAKHVVGIDMSNIIDQAQKIIEANGFKEKITLVKGKLEEAKLPMEEFDIIMSEWMGYFLFYESLIDTMLLARDKYLKKGGLIFPDTATIYLSAIDGQDDKDEKINFLTDVYGFDYSCIMDVARRAPFVDTVDLKSMVTIPCGIKSIDLYTAKKEDLTFDVPFSLTARQNDSIHAFFAWFDVSFRCSDKPVKFSTGAHARYTHWKQTVFYIQTPLTVEEGETVTGRLSCVRNNHDLDIVITCTSPGNQTMEYKMSGTVTMFAPGLHKLSKILPKKEREEEEKERFLISVPLFTHYTEVGTYIYYTIQQSLDYLLCDNSTGKPN